MLPSHHKTNITYTPASFGDTLTTGSGAQLTPTYSGSPGRNRFA
jgi:hypothetical protein